MILLRLKPLVKSITPVDLLPSWLLIKKSEPPSIIESNIKYIKLVNVYLKLLKEKVISSIITPSKSLIKKYI